MLVISPELHLRLKNVFDSAMGRAAEVFSRLTGTNVTAEPVAVSLTNVSERTLNIFKNEVDIVLITPVIGDFPGKSFLVFTKTDAEAISDANGAKSLTPLMQDSLLKEFDNILSAAFISNLCDILKINLYGDVPDLQKLNSRLAAELINTYQPNGELSVICAAGFRSDKPGFAPHFIWKFSSHMLTRAEFL